MDFNSKTGKYDQIESNVQHNFGRYEAHKHHDTMGEIVQGNSNADSAKFNIDNRFKEVKHLKNDNAHQDDADGRHKAHKHHDTMSDIIKNYGNDEKVKYNHDSDFVNKYTNKIKNGNVHQDDTGRYRAHKHHDTMGEIVHGDGKIE